MQDQGNPTNQSQHPTDSMAGRTDKVLDLSAVQSRIDSMRRWLAEQGANCFEEQRHLDEGTPERVYWHYGYLIALQDVMRMLTGHGLKDDNPSDKSSSNRAA
jgi:hypothetical protein